MDTLKTVHHFTKSTSITCILYLFNQLKHMDTFDDIQIEEFSHFDFVEEMNESIEQDEKFDVNDYINSNYDY